jgi:hypothetical protein
VFSIFSPSKTNYNITLSDPTSVSWELGNTYELPKMMMKEENGVEIEDVAIQMWNMRQFSTMKIQNFDGPLKMKINADNDKFSGTIVNNTGKTLKGCLLYSRGNISGAFDLPPGEKQVSLKFTGKGLVVGSSLALFIEKAWGIDNPDTRKTIPLGESKKDIIPTLSDNMLKAGGDLILLGWNEDNIVDLKLNRKSPRIYNTNLFYVR